ncbi:MAG TPA: hypothetical protein VG166_02705 [Caulobacteraceae bacterium]|nr:hypothetical protein [Caulobacteraceae bacterium]
MLKAILERAILFFVPIALGYLWRALSERRAAKSDLAPVRPPPAPMPARTWLWLAALGAVLVGLSLIVGVFLPHEPDRGLYVPGEVRPGGAVTPGRFLPAAKP